MYQGIAGNIFCDGRFAAVAAPQEEIVGDCAKRGVSTFFDARITNRYLGLPKITSDNVEEITHETHGVRTYVKWAQTKYGGKEEDLIKTTQLDEPRMCHSLYGLCE